MKRLITVLVVVGIVAAGIGGFSWLRSRQASAEKPEIIRTTEAERTNLALTIPASGNVNASETRPLSFAISGVIDEIRVDTNERIEQGDELASLQSEDLQRQVERAELGVERAQLELDEAKKDPDPEDVELAELAKQSAAQALEVARIGKQTAQADANRLVVQAQRERENAHIQLREASSGEKQQKEENYQDALVKEHIAKLNAELIIQQAQTEWESAYTQYQQAVQSLDRLQSAPNEDRIALLESQVRQAELTKSQAEDELSETILTAPFDGYVADVEVQENEQVGLGDVILTLVDDARYFINLTVDEIDIGNIQMDQSVDIILDAYPEATLEGYVDRIVPESTELAGITSYQVRIVVNDHSNVDLYEGMTASVDILVDQLKDVLVIPNWAVQVDEETAEMYCYRVVNGEPVRTSIETGSRNENQTVVLSGLEEGNTVALVTQERSFIPEDGPGGPPEF